MEPSDQAGQREIRGVEERLDLEFSTDRSPPEFTRLPKLLVTREEAAGALGMSLSHFQRHVQPEIRCVHSGQLRLYRPQDLERWLEGEVSRRVVRRPTIPCESTSVRLRPLGRARVVRSSARVCNPSGEGAAVPRAITLGETKDRFIEGARAGIVLNKWRRPYRPSSVDDLKSLNRLPLKMLSRPVDRIARGEVQEVVDQLSRDHLSASRISSIVNSLRALYRYAQERELAAHDPAREVRLPVGHPTVRDRVATPAEFDRLLRVLGEQTSEELEAGIPRAPSDARRDAIPYALAAYATARAQEIEVLDWRHVDLRTRTVELAGDEAGRKPGGSWRVVPCVGPLWTLLDEEWVAMGRPEKGRVCPPERIRKSGRKSMAALQRRVRGRWRAAGLQAIGLQEARHTAATWLDHAGVSPRVCSQIMGHKTPAYQPGAARITLERYTHVLPGEMERARVLLEGFIAERAAARAAVRRQIDDSVGIRAAAYSAVHGAPWPFLRAT